VQKHRVQPRPESPAVHPDGVLAAEVPTRVRWLIVLILFLATTINYADRATLSIVGTDLSRDLRLDAVTLGYLLSAFSWSYVAFQLPGGWLLDRLGSRRVYRWSLLGWSVVTIAQAGVGVLGSVRAAAATLFGLRLGLGAAEAPSFPANSRLVAVWFPTAERGLASFPHPRGDQVAHQSGRHFRPVASIRRSATCGFAIDRMSTTLARLCSSRHRRTTLPFQVTTRPPHLR
jgi:hypothetical protein